MNGFSGWPANKPPRLLPWDRTTTGVTATVLCLALLSSVRGAAAGYEAASAANATSSFPWPPGKRGAVSLTFDDARPSQVELGLPIFERHRARATFYVTPDRLDAQLGRWRLAVSQGHEIGNHSLSHPCTGNFAFSRDNALEDYTLARLEEDLRLASHAIRARLGVEPVSFAYPCGQTFIGRGVGTRSYVPLIAERFESGRLWLGEDANDPFRCDPAQLLAMELDGKSFAEVRPLLDSALTQGKWLILAGHEIGGLARQTTLTNTLEAVCAFAADPANSLWLDTVGNIARHVRERQPSRAVPPP
jgi:hypothetical protein